MKFLRKYLSDNAIQHRYVTAGANFGNAVSVIYLGECVGFNKMFNKWADWELEYANRGYNTVSIDDFIKLGGYNKSIEHLLGKKLAPNENPILHAKLYSYMYLGKINPVLDLSRALAGESQRGRYTPPSTKIFSN